MARVFKRKDRLSAMSEINLTSLMDLVFCLLIIFMVATPLLEQSRVQVNLPQESQTLSSPQDTTLKFKHVSITKQGLCYFDDEQVSLAELASRLKALAAQPNPPAIDFRGDKTLTFEKIMDVVVVIRQSGLKQVSVDYLVK